MSERSFREPRQRGFEDEDFTSRPSSRTFATPGFRRQPAAGPPVRARVKWFSPEKGFGFVVIEDGSGDAFLHAGAIERSGRDPADLPEGASVQVRIGPGQKGPQVTEILEVDKSTATVRARPEPRNAAGGTGPMTGTVKWYSQDKRFGFIAVEGGQREVFVHLTALQRSGLAGLAEGQRVTVEVTEGRKGLEALSVRLAG
jgi:cold shock protein